MTRFLARLESADADQNGRLIEVDTETTVVGTENRLAGPVFRSERVTHDMDGLVGVVLGFDSLNTPTLLPGVTGIRLGTYVVPAGSLVIATIYTTEAASSSNTLYPLLRSVDGTSATPLVDTGIATAAGSTDEAVRSNVDPEVSAVTTEACHLGAVVNSRGPGEAELDGDIDASTTAVTISSQVEFPDAPFDIVVGFEKMTVTSKGAGTNWTVTRGIDGTTAAAHASMAAVRSAEVLPLTTGEAHIVFWIAPLEGTLP